MWVKSHKYLLKGIFTFLMFSMLISITTARSSNTIYPLYNYFAFGEKGKIKSGLNNATAVSDEGLQVLEVTSSQPVYKFRFIFTTPEDPFEILSLRVRFIFTENYTNLIRWGYSGNISSNVYPFELAILNGENNSVKVFDALDLYNGVSLQYRFNITAFKEQEYFELSFSSWNATTTMLGVLFEEINFQMLPDHLLSTDSLLLLFSTVGLFGLSIVYPQRFRYVLLVIFAFVLLIVPLSVIINVNNILDTIPRQEKDVTRFTFFGRVYEQKNLGNGYYSLRMVKDLSKAFELQANMGTGSQIVYPVNKENTEPMESVSKVNTKESSNIDENDKTGTDLSLIQIDPINSHSFLFSDISGSPVWWNSSYKYLRQVTITANSALSIDYTVQLDISTSDLVSAGKMLSNCSDLRVVYYNETDSSWYELDRVVLNNNTLQTSIFFRLQKDIIASGSDSNYALYYGIRSGKLDSVPSDTSKIFLDYDDFSIGNLNGYSPNTYWTATSDTTKPVDIGWWSNDDIARGSSSSYVPLNRSNLLTSDTEVLVLLKTTASNAISMICLRSDASSSTPDRIRLEHTSSELRLARYNTSGLYTFDSQIGGFSTSNWYFYKFQIVGGTLKGKSWIAGTTEPTDWAVSSTEGGIPSSGHLIFFSSTSYVNTNIGFWAVTNAVATPPSVVVDAEQEELVKITDISVKAGSYEYYDGSRYWDNNNGSHDEITLVITAVWNVTGEPYLGEVNVGNSTHPNIYGSTTNLEINITGDALTGAINTTDGITVGSAVPYNGFGSDVYLPPSLTHPNLGWDNEAPDIVSITVIGDSVHSSYSDWDTDGVGIQIVFDSLTEIGSGLKYYEVDVDNSPPTAYITISNPYTYPVDVGSSGDYTFYAQPVDNVGNEGTIRSAIGYVDEEASTLTDFIFTDADYSTNWYDQGSSSSATYQITFTSDNNAGTGSDIASISVTCIIDGSDRANDPSGIIITGVTETITISGRSDGDNYGVSVTLTDKCGRSDSTFSGVNNSPLKLDDSGPIGYSVNMESGVFYADITNDSTPTVTSSDGTDGSIGVGLDHTTEWRFRYRIDGGSYVTSTWQSSNIYIPTIVSSTDDLDIEVQLRDTLGNEGSWIIDHDNVVDIDTPSFVSIGGSESSSSLYALGTAVDYGYYSDNMGTTLTDFNVIGNVLDNFGFEKVNGTVAFSDTPEDSTLVGTSDSFTCTYTINNADLGSGTLVVTITVYDQAGNFDTRTFTFYEDNTDPILTDIMSNYSESGETGEVHGDIGTNTFYFSNSFPGSNYANVIFTATGADSISGVRGVDFGTWGGYNPTEDTEAPYTSGISGYLVSDSSTAGTISVIIYDNCENFASGSIDCVEDGTNPTIEFDTALIEESSPYLYYDGSSYGGYYSDNMGATSVLFNISGIAYDNGILASITDDTSFGGDPSQSGLLTNWYFEYWIDENNASGLVTTTYRATDVVGNYQEIVFMFFYDDTSPDISPAALYNPSNSPYLYVNSTIRHFYFSNLMGSSSVELIINGTVSDVGTVQSGHYSINIPSRFGSSSSQQIGTSIWNVSYYIDANDVEQNQGWSSLVIIATDNVGNKANTTVTYIKDHVAPSIVSMDQITKDPQEKYLYIDNSTAIYYSNVGSGGYTFTVRVYASETRDYLDSGLKNASFPNIFAVDDGGFNATGNTKNERYWEWSYTITFDWRDNPSNTNITVEIRVYDKVNNSATVQFQILLDDVPPIVQIVEVWGWESSWYLYYSGGTLIYSNNQQMDELLYFNITVSDNFPGRASANGTEAFGGEIPTATDYSKGYYLLVYHINQDEVGNVGDITRLNVTGYDILGNGATVSIDLVVDNDGPVIDPITDVSVLTSTEYVFYNSTNYVLYYSNDQNMAINVRIRITAIDTVADLENATLEDDFGSGVSDLDYSTYYELIFQINEDEIASGGILRVWIYDKVGNRNPVDLTCSLDNDGPSINIDTILENSVYIYYNPSTSLFYYNNQYQSTGHEFIIRLFAFDSGVGILKNATGETEFGDSPTNTTYPYPGNYEITYTIEQYASVADENITIWVYDYLGNKNSENLTVHLDDTAPQDVTITSVEYYGSKYIYLVNNSGILILYVSNQAGSLQLIDIYVNNIETESGRLLANGSSFFGDSSPITSTYQYVLHYSIAFGDPIPSGTGENITIWTWDRVGNYNKVNLTVIGDTNAPQMVGSPSVETYGSDYVYYDGSLFYFSDNMPGTQLITINGTCTDNLSGIRKIVFESAFGSIVPQNFSSYWTADYGIDSSDSEQSMGSGSIEIVIYDRVNNNITIYVDYTPDHTDPVANIDTITEDLLDIYLHYVVATTTLWHSNIGSGSRKFTVRVTSSDVGGAGINFADFPNIGASIGGLDYDYADSFFNYTYTIGSSSTYNNSVIITVFDRVHNNDTVSFNFYLDDSPPQASLFALNDYGSEFLHYISNIFYYSNIHQTSSQDFTLDILAYDAHSGIFNATGSYDFGESHNDLIPSGNHFELTYSVALGEDASDNDLSVTIYDQVGNSFVLHLITASDNTLPSGVNLVGIIETSYFIYYNGTVLWYSNDNSPTMSEQFFIRISCTDSGSGIYRAVGENEFGETNVIDSDYTTYYELPYTIDFSELAAGDDIKINITDYCGNNYTYNLVVLNDNDEPTSLEILLVETFSSEFLYYNGYDLYYSNTNSGMNELLQIQINATDSKSGLFNATGENDFGDSGIEDPTYLPQKYYLLIYTINQNDFASGDQLDISIFDLVGNEAIYSLDCILDNDAPSLVELIDIIEDSDFIYDDGNTLWFSSDQAMSDQFTMRFNLQDADSGIKNVTGTFDLGEMPFCPAKNIDGYYHLNYTIDQSDNTSNGQIQVSVFDRVGNVNSTYILSAILDNTPPINITVENIIESSPWLFAPDNTVLYYSNRNNPQSAVFTVNITAQDLKSGLLRMNGSPAFNEAPSDSTYLNGFQVDYTINYNENEVQIIFTLYDNVMNFDIVTLDLTKDNNAPINIDIIEVSDSPINLYYNGSTLFYSNWRNINSEFYLIVVAADVLGGAGLLNANGSSDFGLETPNDSSYVSGFNLSYTISINEDAGFDNQTIITVYDRCGNSNTITLKSILDNESPDITIEYPAAAPTWNNTQNGIASFGGFALDKGWIFKSGITASSFNYSINGGINNSFIVDVLTNNYWNENGGDPTIPTISNEAVTLTIYIWDQVGNVNSSTITIWHDDTPPAIDYNWILFSGGVDEPLKAGNTTRFYAISDESNIEFDIDFLINVESHSFYSNLIKAEYRTDVGSTWFVIFDTPTSSDNTTDWKILDWDTNLFNGENTIDIRVTDAAGNVLTHTYSPGVSGFNFRLAKYGPKVLWVTVEGNEAGISDLSLYDWDGLDFYLGFNFNSTAPIIEISIYSDQNATIQSYTNGSGLTWYIEDFYNYTAANQLINYNFASSEGNRSIYVRAKDESGWYSGWVEVHLFVDFSVPTISFQSITEVSIIWAIYAFGNTLYFSNEMGSSHAEFNVTVNTGDTGSGPDYVSFEPFGPSNVIARQNVTDTGEFYVDSSFSGSIIYATAYDKSGRKSSITPQMIMQIEKDNSAPINLNIEGIIETSEFIYFNGTTLFFSNIHANNQAFSINVTADDTQSGLANLTGSDNFGEVPSDNTYSNGFVITYHIDIGESEVLITCNVFDFVGNKETVTLTCNLDNVEPNISLSNAAVSEGSDFLYYPNNGTQILWYSNNMPSEETISITVITSDGISGVQVVEFPAFFNRMTDFNVTSYSQDYLISSVDSDTGFMTFICFDNCGNVNSTQLEVRRDNQAPSGSITAIDETSLFIYSDSLNSTLWYSDQMGVTDVPVDIIVAVSDIGTSAAGIYKIVFPTIGDESAVDVLYPNVGRTYHFTASDSGSYSVSFIIQDLCGNTAPIALQLVEDLTPPNIVFIDVTDPDYDPDGIELDMNGNWYDQGELSGFIILYSRNDPLNDPYPASGLYDILLLWDSTNDANDSQNYIGTSGIHTVNGVDSHSDGTITVTLFIFDNCNNSNQASIRINFDNTNPSYTNTTFSEQGGKMIFVSGTANDGGSGVDYITLNDSHFPTFIESGFDDWSLSNISVFSDVLAGTDIPVKITVFDNVNNSITYNSIFTYHSIKFSMFITNIPKRVEIDDPGTWNITVAIEYDGSNITDSTVVIDRTINQISQYNAWIDSTPLTIDSLYWNSGAENFTLTVILPSGLFPIGEANSKDISVVWGIFGTDLQAQIDNIEFDAVSYHDLEISYTGDENLGKTEKDNPDTFTIDLHLEKDYNSYTGGLSANTIGLTIDQISGTFVGYTNLGNGDYQIDFLFPEDITTGSKDVIFTWKFDNGEYKNVIESNTTNNLIRYHDIAIFPSIAQSMRLIEVDNDFIIQVDFTITEDEGDQSYNPVNGLAIDRLIAFIVNDEDLLVEVNSFSGSAGSYSFDFVLSAITTTPNANWLGNLTILFQINSTTSNLAEWGETFIIGHDLQMTIDSIYNVPAYIQTFDPDETTTFELTITVQDDNGSGLTPVNNPPLNFSNLIELYFKNINSPDRNVSFIDLSPWSSGAPGTYIIEFELKASDAIQLSVGEMEFSITINDTHGHRVVAVNTDLQGVDFVTLIGLRWVATPYGNFSFIEDGWESGIYQISSNATADYTFRVSTDSEIILNFWVYGQENPQKTPKEGNFTLVWETPWNVSYMIQSWSRILSSDNVTSQTFTISVTSDTPILNTFLAYIEGNKEKQIDIAPWRLHLEWDEIEAETTLIEEDVRKTTTADDPSVLNIDGKYILVYNPYFVQSGRSVGNCTFEINLTYYSFNENTLEWEFINSEIVAHLDGSGTNVHNLVNGQMTIVDNIQSLNKDGKIQIELEFNEIIKASLDVRIVNETGSSLVPYRYYSSYGSPYMGPVISFVDETTNTIFLDTPIWTKFIVNMYPDNSRISELTPGTIYIEAYYAHNYSIPINAVRVSIWDNKIGTTETTDQWISNRATITDLIRMKDNITFNIVSFRDTQFGITLFEDNTTKSSIVNTWIIWDRVIFELALADPWGSLIRFNVGTSANILITAYYDYDKTPFNGTIALRLANQLISAIEISPIEWNESISLDITPIIADTPSNAPLWIDSIIQDNKYGLLENFQTFAKDAPPYAPGYLILRWDRMIVDLSIIGESVTPGDLANVTLLAYYESDENPVGTFIYSLEKDSLPFFESNRSLLYFFDSEISETSHIYEVVFAYDSSTNLTWAYSTDGLPNPSIEISWIDIGVPPELIEHQLIDFGNGTLGFIVVATDDDLFGKYLGSGVDRVVVQVMIIGSLGGPGNPQELSYLFITETIDTINTTIVYDTIETDLNDETGRNRFVYGSELNYTIMIYDKRGNVHSYIFSTTLKEDYKAPELLEFDLQSSSEIDGGVVIMINATDSWSKLDRAIIEFFDPNTNEWSFPQNMSSQSNDLENTTRSFWISSVFNINDEIDYRITIFDKHGNEKIVEGKFLVLDKTAPQLIDLRFIYSELGQFSIEMTVGDNGSEIESAMIYYRINGGSWVSIDLSEETEGGIGSISAQLHYEFSSKFSKSFAIFSSFLESSIINFKLEIIDSEGNKRSIGDQELSPYLSGGSIKLTPEGYRLPPLGFELIANPIVILIVLGVVFGFILITVRRLRTISGFDKKIVMGDITKISDTEVWENNDKISFGLIASFFDQVKGPVPIIVYPDKIMKSEAILSTIADRSFSTLGFVANPDEDKHATFRFQLAGEKCTVFGYTFALKNPEARGGQENLSICFIIKPPWSNLENINKFLNELLDRFRKIHSLIEEKADVKIIQNEMEETRNFYTKAMLAFRRRYKKEFVE